MPFRNFVQIGRVAFIAYGRYEKKLCVIVDVIDQNRALVDGPRTGVPRCQVRFKQLHLTKFVIRIPHSTSSKVVRRAWDKAKITQEWEKTGWYKRLQMRKVKSKLTDFDRFKLMVYKKKRNQIIKDELAKMKYKMRTNPTYKKSIIRPQRNRHAKITKTKKEALLKLRKAKLSWHSQKKHKEALKKKKLQEKYEKKKALRDPNKPVAPKKVVLKGKKLRKSEAEKAKAAKEAKKALIAAKVAAKKVKAAEEKPGDKPLKKKRKILKIKPKVVRPTAGVNKRNPGALALWRRRHPGVKKTVKRTKKFGAGGKKPGAGGKKVVPGIKKPVVKKSPKKATDPKKAGEAKTKPRKPRQKKTAEGAKPKAETAPVAATQ